MNKVIIMGNLGADPEARTLPNGHHVTELSIATTRRWTTTEGERCEATEWHSVQVWGATALACAKYLRKGGRVLVSGRIQTDKWKDKDTGETRYRTRIVADVRDGVTFLLDRRAGSEGDSEMANQAQETEGDSWNDEIPY